MGIYSDLLALGTVLPTAAPRVGIDRAAAATLQRQIDIYDPDIAPAYAATNEVQTMAASTATGGTFRLGVTLATGEVFTTAAIAFDASGATIETALNQASVELTADWTSGEISVTGTAADSTPIVFTFDGPNVAGLNHPLITVNGASLTGGTAGAIVETDQGYPDRLAISILFGLNIVQGTIPTIGAAVTDWTKGEPIVPQASFSLIQTLADQAGIEGEDISVINALKDLYGPGIR